MKDGYYDHGQNCVEYSTIKFGPIAPTEKQLKPKPRYVPPPRWGDGLGWMS